MIHQVIGRPLLGKAFQWTENLREAEEFFECQGNDEGGVVVWFVDDKTNDLYLHGPAICRTTAIAGIPINDWIVKDENGSYSAYSEKHFEEKFMILHSRKNNTG